MRKSQSSNQRKHTNRPTNPRNQSIRPGGTSTRRRRRSSPSSRRARKLSRLSRNCRRRCFRSGLDGGSSGRVRVPSGDGRVEARCGCREGFAEVRADGVGYLQVGSVAGGDEAVCYGGGGQGTRWSGDRRRARPRRVRRDPMQDGVRSS